MFVAGNLLGALATMLDMALTIYMWLIIVRSLISWVNPDPYNPIVQFLIRATEPVLMRVRAFIPFRNIGIDLSPIIVIFAIIFFKQAVVLSLMQAARTMG